MRSVSYLDTLEKMPASALSNFPQSDIFPGMVKIAYDDKKKKSNKLNKASFSLNKPNPNLNTNLLPVALATMGGFIIGKATGKIVERPIDNFPAGLIGAGVCGAAIIGTTGYYVAKYGGFFDKDRDFKTMFKNM